IKKGKGPTLLFFPQKDKGQKNKNFGFVQPLVVEPCHPGAATRQARDIERCCWAQSGHVALQR
ncbi:MAG: hypothetical protein ACPIOQ_50980, partial [Promethearchaeia archaeon]